MDASWRFDKAIAIPKGREGGLQYLREFVEDVKASGLVAREVEKAGVGDATVSPAERVRSRFYLTNSDKVFAVYRP